LQDYRQRISHNVITETTKRLTPGKWLKFARSSLLLNMYNNGQPHSLLSKMMENFYDKRRKERYLYAFDSSMRKTGKQISKNWIGQANFLILQSNICIPNKLGRKIDNPDSLNCILETEDHDIRVWAFIGLFLETNPVSVIVHREVSQPSALEQKR